MAPVYEIGVNIETRPQGDEIEVPPFGSVENGGTLTDIEMTEEDAQKYDNTPGLTVRQTSSHETEADKLAKVQTSTIEDAPSHQPPPGEDDEEDEEDDEASDDAGGGE